MPHPAGVLGWESMRMNVLLTSAALLLGSCGEPVETPSMTITDAEAACVSFYRSAEESTEDEATYMRVLADQIAAAGHKEAGLVLSDLADQWEAGTWEGDEITQLAQWAEAGALLAGAGELRCTDLAEWWRIDGYEGQPDPIELLNRQKRIWDENGLDGYYLLVAAKTPNDERFTQRQVKVVDGQVDQVREVEIASLQPSSLPRTIDEYYDLVFDQQARAEFFSLVHAYPRRALTPDGIEYVVRLDTSDYPDALEYVDIPEE